MLKKMFSTGLAWLWIAILLLAIDRYAKFWVFHHFIPYQPFKLLPILNITLAYNTGAAFSFLHSASGWQNVFLGSMAAIISVIIFVWLYKLSARECWMNIALCFVLSGAIGNAWDRVLYGHVIDFFQFHLGDWYFAIFNIADSAICIGGFMLFLYWMRQRA